jgi:hypothetical protein
VPSKKKSRRKIVFHGEERVPFLGRLSWVALMLWLVASPLAGASDIDRVLALPEEKIDIGIAALTFAKEFYPSLDVAAYSRKIDQLANQVRVLAQGTQDPE